MEKKRKDKEHGPVRYAEKRILLMKMYVQAVVVSGKSLLMIKPLTFVMRSEECPSDFWGDSISFLL